jgi:hypothetical protein
VLDEADVGVGGTTADTVGRILRDLAAHTQVLCVTHCPASGRSWAESYAGEQGRRPYQYPTPKRP